MSETQTPKPKREDFANEYPNVGFNRTAHHLALEQWAGQAEQKIKELQHHKDTTIGLYATDRPDLIVDNDNVMFQIS